MARKQRVDSIAAHLAIAADAGAAIVPPAHVPLSAGDMPFWESVVREFARADWTDHQLELAAMLARNMADATRNQELLRQEGEVVATANGTPTPNPRLAAMRMLATNILAYRRSLGVHARARDGDNRTTANKAKAGRQVEADVTGADDDFIPRASLN